MARVSLSWLFRRRERYRRGLLEECPEVVVGVAEADEEVGDVAALAYLLRQLQDPRLRNETADVQRAVPAGYIPIEADIDPGDRPELRRPVAPRPRWCSRDC